MSFRKFGRKSFTLIELLVVIAIIAILAAMLLPALNKARMQSYKSKCVANMKQFGIGFAMYRDDMNGEYPINRNYTWAVNYDGSTSVLRVGLGLLYTENYLRSPGIYCCPADKKDKSPTVLDNTYKDNNNKSAQMSYRYTYPVLAGVMPLNQLQGIHRKDIPKPSEAGLLADMYGISTNVSRYKFGNHMDGANALCADGHVAFSKNTDVKDWGYYSEAYIKDYLDYKNAYLK